MGVMTRLREFMDPVGTPLPARQVLPWTTFDGVPYAIGLNQTLAGNREEVGPGLGGLVAYSYMGNAIVHALMVKRFMTFSEARFVWQEVEDGIPGEISYDGDLRQPANRGLRLLANPEPGKTTSDLLARAMVDVDTAGNAFFVRRSDAIRLLRPEWTTIVIGSSRAAIDGSYDDLAAWDIDASVIGYLYQPGGPALGSDLVAFAASEVAHFAPTPDPFARYRGMSWLAPVIRELMADSAATNLKLAYFEHGATPNLKVTIPVVDPAKFREWTEVFEAGHAGARNAWRTMYLGQGSDATVIGSNLSEMDFSKVQGGGETRLAAAAGVPPVLAGFSEGLQGSSLNAGNYNSARRSFADLLMRPLWRNLCGTLEQIVPPPAGKRLWYDFRSIPFLAEDMKDAAEVLAAQAQAIRTLVDGGYEPDSVVDAVTSGDLGRLEGAHTGMLSVQLHEPGAKEPPEPQTPQPGDGEPAPPDGEEAPDAVAPGD